MCLGAYGVVIEVKGDIAVVDFGGVRKEVLVATEGVGIGSYVVVHAGVIISTMDEITFKESIKELERLLGEINGDLDHMLRSREVLKGGS